MKKYEVKINSDTVDYLERLSYEVEGMKRVIKEIITDSAFNTAIFEAANFKAYNQKYEERIAAYEVAKDEMIKTVIPAEVRDANAIAEWNLDFSTGILTFTTIGSDFDNLAL